MFLILVFARTCCMDGSHIIVYIPSSQAGKFHAEASTKSRWRSHRRQRWRWWWWRQQGQRWTAAVFFLREKWPRFNSITRPPPYESPRSMAMYARLSLHDSSHCVFLSAYFVERVWVRARILTTDRPSERKSGQNEARSLHSKNGNTRSVVRA